MTASTREAGQEGFSPPLAVIQRTNRREPLPQAAEAGAQYEGQGNHQLSVADVDGDQRDEIVFGAMTIDDDGTALYNTGLGHGDVMHVGDFDPQRPGLEVFSAHESMGQSGNRVATFRDAATGEVLWAIPAARDTGRAAMADVDPRHPGAEGWPRCWRCCWTPAR